MRKITYLLVRPDFAFNSCSARKNTISNRQAYRNNLSIQQSHR